MRKAVPKREKRGRLGGHPEVGLRCTALRTAMGTCAPSAHTQDDTRHRARESAGEWSGERRYQISERELSTADPSPHADPETHTRKEMAQIQICARCRDIDRHSLSHAFC